MQTKAAVAFKAGAPLSIETVDLEGPRAGEVLVEIKATGVCHTDEFTLSGGDPEGLFPSILGHEGAGVVLEVCPGVNVVVFGLGSIGLNVIQGARMAGADKIIGVDLNPAKTQMARKFGMTDFINPDEVGRDKVVQAIVDLTGGGADFSFECIG